MARIDKTAKSEDYHACWDFISEQKTVKIEENKQMRVSGIITIDGILIIDGMLVID